MTFNKTFTAFTDYPFTDLGDISGESAPTREIEVLTYDRDKYALVRVKGTEAYLSIKSGYIYQDAALTKRPNRFKLYSLPLEEGGASHTRKEVSYYFHKERNGYTRYRLYFNAKTEVFFNLKDALHIMGVKYCTTDCDLSKETRRKLSWLNAGIASSEKGIITFMITRRNISALKTKHFKKYFCR